MEGELQRRRVVAGAVAAALGTVGVGVSNLWQGSSADPAETPETPGTDDQGSSADPAETPETPGTDGEATIVDRDGGSGGGRNWQRVGDILRSLEEPIDYRDSESNLEGAEPAPGAVFVATDTERIYFGDGDAWRQLPETGVGAPEDRAGESEPDRIRRVDPADGYQGLREALDDLGETPGTVLVGSGRIDDIDGNVVIPSHTHLRGVSASETTLAFADGADPDLAGLLRVTGEDVEISDLELDGNRANVSLGDENLGQEYGFYTSGADTVVVRRVYCHDFPGYGFDPHADGERPSRNVSVIDCVARRNGFDGVTFAGVTNGFVANNCSIGNDRHGITATDPEGDGVTFANNVAVGNGACGAVVQNGSSNVTFRANLLGANDEHGVRIGTTTSTVENVRLARNLVRNSGKYGVNVRSCRSVAIVDNEFETNNASGEADAVIGLTVTQGTATSVRIADNEIRARESTPYGVFERQGNGPTTVTGNDIRGIAETAVRTTHPDSVVETAEEES